MTLDLSADDFIVASLKWVSNNSGWSKELFHTLEDEENVTFVINNNGHVGLTLEALACQDVLLQAVGAHGVPFDYQVWTDDKQRTEFVHIQISRADYSNLLNKMMPSD